MNITKVLPESFLPLAGRAIMLGFQSYELTLEQFPAFSRNAGKNLRSSILHAFTEEALLQQLSKNPIYKCVSTANKNGSYSFIQIVIHDKCIITSSRVPNEKTIPRRALFREYRSQGNLVLFDELYPEYNTCLPYLIITHGINHQANLPFAAVGMPDGLDRKQWADYSSLREYLSPVEEAPEEIAAIQSNVQPLLTRVMSNAT
jgi:hypothetical protein